MGCAAKNTNWAVRVPPTMETSHDIIPASSALLMLSPSPFGVKICTLPGNESSQGSAQKLFYVSKQAALDRAPEKHAMNGVGVKPGWYMIGDQGMFHVHAGPVKKAEYAQPSENGLLVSLKVDGQDTNKRYIYKKKGTIVEGSPSLWHGFTKSRLIEAGTCMQNSKVDKFCFENISDALEGNKEVPTDTGTISMQVSAGVIVKCGTYSGFYEEKYDYSKQEISAKTVAREGRSMRVGSSGWCTVEACRLADWNVRSNREIEAARITIFVRSRHWLQSRRVIDENDRPFKYVDLVEARNAYAAAGTKRLHVLCSTVNENERPRKKRYDGNQEQCVEVIDLT